MSLPVEVTANTSTVAPFSPLPEYSVPVGDTVLPPRGLVSVGAIGGSASTRIVRGALEFDEFGELKVVDWVAETVWVLLPIERGSTYAQFPSGPAGKVQLEPPSMDRVMV